MNPSSGRRRVARAAAPLAALVVALASTPAPAQVGPLGRAPSRFALFEGSRVHFKSLGTGRTAVVLVHGIAGDMNIWAAQADALAGRARVVLIDLPGHGRSDKPQTTYSPEYLARAVDAVLGVAEVEQAVLVGHSMGALVARESARLFPKRVLALVAVDGLLQWTTSADSAAMRRTLDQLRGPDYRAALGEFLTGLAGPTASPELRQALLHTGLATPQHVVVSAIEGMLDRSVWRSDVIPVPVLAVMAKGPDWLPQYRRSLGRVAPQLTYEEIDGVGHYLMAERPEVFNPILTRFLSLQQVLR